MGEKFGLRTRLWAFAAAVLGIVFLVGLELIEEPESSMREILFEILKALPVVLTSVGVARVQGQCWRSEARSHLDGLGRAINEQFSRWNLTEAEREVALLLLKGLSIKEIASVRATSERTIREQARSIYTKAGLTGRAALSAFFLEDLLAPIEGLE